METLSKQWLAILITELIVVLVLLVGMAIKSEQHTQQINATLLAQGVGANSIRCVSGDAVSCALATQESMASPVTPTSSTDPQPEVTVP